MNARLSITTVLVALASFAMGQVSLTAVGVPAVVDFTGFTGAGFALAGDSGRLDADDWAVTGLSDGAKDFGVEDLNGDYAKGVTTGGIFSGGLYAYDLGSDPALLVQPTGSDWTPGTITLRLQNNTGSTASEISVAYDLIVNNNEDRANSYNFSFSLDNITYNAVPALDYTSVEDEDTLGFTVNARSTTLGGLSVADGQFVYVRWEGDDVSGGGSRDEFALDNINVTVTSTAVVSAFNFASAAIDANEGDGSVDVAVDVTATADCDVDVNVTGGTADGSDYTFAGATLSFTSGGATTQTATIVLNDDMVLELDETIELEIANPTGSCLIGSAANATVTISDNDSAPFGECQNLYFSEYIEGSSSNKALEIYNPTDDMIDLSAYSVSSYNNGATSPTNTQLLSGMLAPGDVYIIGNSSADSALAATFDITSTVTFYNGDDAIVLFNGGDTLDIIGLVGEDPGSSWGVDTGATNEHTLVRRPEVKQGQLDWSIASATEWIAYDQNDFSFIGSHTQDACTVACSSATPPQNPGHTVGTSSITLNWDAVAGSVACQVRGTRLVPAGPSPSVNLFGSEPTTTNVPFGAAGAGTTWEWSVRCACTVSPIDATDFSETDTFSVPSLRLAEVVELNVFPNPSTDVVNMTWNAGASAEATIELLDILGRVVSMNTVRVEAGANTASISVSELDNGVYFIRMNGEEVSQITVAH